ncbi:unnamed protein product (macronuclear) [Paramecium tetraurelia]|uniref:IBB domain-containing protein n=1 Tax=Paramecium tetraurelia TaxID=5888 RepID=A0CQY6_PARTE|nr:uncharacterized protein GSPATT00038859001 [Paramecium tetraurelia]CAK73203.1 unnamed protein product [Paramecium tetraurelia]|eukprot:XP_001440600.1 hypothetical protein (macronuclear) [Paramecium tetraurelia strain d4-2]
MNSELQMKREQFMVQIRKQAREEIFSKKRQTSLGQEGEVVERCNPDEIINFIYQTYLEQDFKHLARLLKQYNLNYLKLLEEQNINDLPILNQFITHFSTNGNSLKLFFDIIRMSGIPLEINLTSDRLMCIIQVLVILINFTYLERKDIVENLLQNDLITLLLKDLMSRMVSPDKVQIHFDRWCEILESICLILINVQFELDNRKLLIFREETLRSQLFRVWSKIYPKNPIAKAWRAILLLECKLLESNEIDLADIPHYNFNCIISQCTYLIDKVQIEDDNLCKRVLEILQRLSEFKVTSALTLTLTKFVWEKILKLNLFPHKVFSIFTNFLAEKDNDHYILQYLIDIGLIESMINSLMSLADAPLIEIIYKCFNNILYYPHAFTVEKAISVFIPFLHNYFNQSSILKQELCMEYLFLLQTLVVHQQLSDYHLNEIFINLDCLKYISQMLLMCTSLTKYIAELFITFPKLPEEFKSIILEKVDNYDFVEILNNQATMSKDDGCINLILNLIQLWEQNEQEIVIV